MLSKVTIKNFKSINSLSLDLSFAEKKYIKRKDGELFDVLYATEKSKTENKNRFVPVANIYGPNASGKTSIVEAIRFFVLLIRHGLRIVPYLPNRLEGEKGDTFLEFVFFLNQNEYTYELSYNSHSIKREVLTCEGQEMFSIIEMNTNFKNIEVEDFNEEYLQKQFKIACLTAIDGQQVKTFLSFVVDKLPGLNSDLVDVFNFFNKNFDVSLKNDFNTMHAIRRLAKSDDKKDINDAIDKIADVIRNIDIDINRFSWVEEQGDLNLIREEAGRYNFSKFIKTPKGEVNFRIDESDNKFSTTTIKSYHKNKSNQEVEFDFHEESSGTHVAFGLIGFILSFFETGGVLVVDEFDNSLHPLVLATLVKMFKSSKYNKSNAQLILTLHTTDILEDKTFKISDFYFVNKSKKKGTYITRLSDFEGVRNEMNFRDRYLRGEYFGIPYTFN